MVEKKNNNAFRIERSIIKEKFIGSFTATNFNIDNYVKTSLPNEWLPTNKQSKVKTITTSDYEETIIKFIETPAQENISHPLLIIVGGTGSGKSTTINYALKKAELCSGCSAESCDKTNPLLVKIDFLKNETEVSKASQFTGKYSIDEDEHGPLKLSEKEFWSLIITKLDFLLGESLSPNVEISEFWHWLLIDSKNIIFEELYRKLYHKRHLVKSPLENSKELFELRDTIYENFSQESLCLYKVLQLQYIRKELKGNCNLIVFDDIDSIPPYLQRKSLKIALKFCELLKCRAIIPMRPHTFELNNHAANFMEVFDHWTPNIFEVLLARNEQFSKHSSSTKDISTKIDKLIKFIQADKFREEAFIATCGNSSRFALRNIYNLLLSPLIVTDDDFISLDNIGSNVFYTAFFCSEVTHQRMYEKNFTNLFSIKLHDKTSYYSNIKLRILHYLFNANSTGMMIKNLTSELKSYGYEEPEIVAAINDLILNRKPILWSDNVLFYDNDSIFQNHHILITPLGINYYNKLLNHMYYLRECVVCQDEKRIYNTDEWVIRCVEVMYDLEKRDYRETYRYLSNNPAANYKYYFKETNSISSILWGKLHPSLVYFSKMTKTSVDLKREDVVKENISKMIDYKELTEDVTKAIFG